MPMLAMSILNGNRSVSKFLFLQSKGYIMSNLTIYGIESKIKEHKQELADLEAQLVKAKLESPDHQLAKELHNMLCKWNHTDGCGWFYEFKNKEDDWTGHAHGAYLKKAQMLIHKCEQNGIPVESALEIYKDITTL